MSEALVIYHRNCYDGYCAYWVAQKALGSAREWPAQYGDAPPPDEEIRNRRVYILDFSYPREVLERFNELAASLVVLDHHKTAQEDLEGLDYARFDIDECGASMAWSFFFPGEPLPKLVAYIRDRDLWQWKMPFAKEVQGYIRSHSFELISWDLMNCSLSATFEEVVRMGRLVLQYQTMLVEMQLMRAREVVLCGRTFRVANHAAEKMASEVAGQLSRATGYGAIWSELSDGRYVWQLRASGDARVDDIARSYGGGGHAKASGFVVEPDAHFEIISSATNLS